MWRAAICAGLALAGHVLPAGAGPELTAAETVAARKLYVAKCAKCHKFYEPTNYLEADWDRWMGTMGRKARLKTEQDRLLRRYLDAYRAGRVRDLPRR